MMVGPVGDATVKSSATRLTPGPRSINCGFSAEGLPIGLQMIAPRFADQWLLQVAKAYEGWRGAIQNWPSSPSC